jgi:hypothetical protein
MSKHISPKHTEVEEADDEVNLLSYEDHLSYFD